MTYETNGTPNQDYSNTKGASLIRVLPRGFSSHDVLEIPTMLLTARSCKDTRIMHLSVKVLVDSANERVRFGVLIHKFGGLAEKSILPRGRGFTHKDLLPF